MLSKIAAMSMAFNLVLHSRTKHIEVDVHFIQEKIASNQLKVWYVPRESQEADVMTKALSVEKYLYFRNKLHVTNPLQYILRANVKQ